LHNKRKELMKRWDELHHEALKELDAKLPPDRNSDRLPRKKL